MTQLLLLLVLTLAAVVAGGTLLAGRLIRARFCPSAATFPCLVRVVARGATSERARWPRRRWRAAWAHDVLLLQRGRLVPRVVALAVRMPDEALRVARPGELGGLGRDPVVVLLRLDDGSLVEVAAEHARRHDLVGPFLAAAIPGLPRGPRERPPLGR